MVGPFDGHLCHYSACFVSMMDQFTTISDSATGEYKEKGSKFIAYIQRCPHEDSFKTFLNRIQQEHHKARHHCWGFSVGLAEHLERSNDDGEPSGSAGLPILNQIKSANLHQVGIVVVRYFGGTKLGVSGLIRAYKEAARLAISAAQTTVHHIQFRWKIEFEYSLMNEVMSLHQQQGIQIVEQSLTESPHVMAGAVPSEKEEKLEIIKKILSKKPLDYDIDLELSGEGFQITELGIA